jgi:aspartate beta-hydroxylase/beta-hydroxylase
VLEELDNYVSKRDARKAQQSSFSKSDERVRRVLNALFLRSVGGDRRPPLIQPTDVFPECREFEDRFDDIRAEVDRLLERRSLARYHDIDPMRATEVARDWRLYFIYMMGEFNERARIDCPTVVELVKNMPRAISAIISVLEPGVNLAAHSGPYAGVLRYHLALRVPRNRPPSIRVKDQHYTWKEREAIVLDDCFEHEVINQSDDLRVVLMVDFRRPMNPIYDRVNRFALSRRRQQARELIRTANLANEQRGESA